ncbi:MAG: hypothetical protein MIO90_02960 [Methanomassiliicoccales archaeon]|nr:hypothetical protein [Methanomassiliicoccales archaeon]
MKYDTGNLEGGYRLAHINRTKRYLFVAQAIIVLVFATYLIVAEGGFSMKPFFLSVNSFLYFVLIMLLVISLEGFFFIILEMRFMKSDSAKFIMTQRAFRSSMLWAVVALIVLMVLWAPIVPEILENDIGENSSISSSSSTVPGMATMFNTDALGLTEVSGITLTATGLSEVFIVTEDNYELFKNDGKDVLGGYRVNQDYMADPEIVVDFPDTAHSRFYILVYSVDDVPVTVDYTTTGQVSNSLMTYLPLLMMMFLVSQATWAAYMFIMNKRFKEGIYR